MATNTEKVMATNTEIDSTEGSSISVLPEDILFDVFDYLKACERNNAKLVCKSWLRILSRPYFTRHEELRLPVFYDLAAIMEVIDNWSHDKMNVKFVKRHIMQNSELFWERCGQKINSLSFDCCFYHPDMISEIFEHCVNLEEFVSRGTLYNQNYSNHQLIAQKFFRKSGSSHLSRPKLLKVDLGCLPVSPSDLNNIAIVFPNLKTLKFEVTENAESYFPTIRNLIETGRMRIEELHIIFREHDSDFPNNVHSAQKFISSNRTVKVTVSLDIKPELCIENNIRQISSYNFLTSLTVISSKDRKPTDMTLLARFINETPLLNRLVFTLFLTTNHDFCIIWSALVNSRLTYLHIELYDMDATLPSWSGFAQEIDSSLAGLKSNSTVQYLTFSNYYGNAFSLLISKYFQGVYNLNLEKADLTLIFLYQKQLRSIHVFMLSLSDITLSPTSVESIERLEVGGETDDLVMELFSLYRFPNLKDLSLMLECDDETTMDWFRTNLQKLASILLLESPKLTKIEMVDLGTTFQFPYQFCREFFQFCRAFHNLQHIRVSSILVVAANEADLMQEISRHVDQWPSLKELSIVTRNIDFCYFYNAVKREYEFFDRTSTYWPEPPSMH